jgi:hypothetical protein
MKIPHSDALVFFGATGDLIYKKIFPALYAMERRGHLPMPVIGVARSDWTIEEFRACARASAEKDEGFDEAVFAKLSKRLRYISGDYGAPATHAALLKELGEAAHPLHFLAIPPSVFEKVVEQLGQSGCARGARIILEKLFGRDLDASVQEILEAVADRAAIEQNFHDLKEVHGAGKQQLRNYWANIAAYHVTMWWHTLIELWAWKKPQDELTDRTDSPWDDPTRRPSHADRRNALRRECLKIDFQRAEAAATIPRKFHHLWRRLLKLVA